MKATKNIARFYVTIVNPHITSPSISSVVHQQQVEHQSPNIPLGTVNTKPQINKSGRIWGWDKNKQAVDSMIRVDQAGEFGAVVICKGQSVILSNDPTISEIQVQEEGHLRVMEDLVQERRVRPTIMSPFWQVAGFALGASTALLGRPAAMACHKAVEDVISQHYNDQIREIYAFDAKEDVEDFEQDKLTDQEKKQRETDYLFSTAHDQVPEKELRSILKQFRDEELHHGEMAVENDAQSAPFYSGLYNIIKSACNTAIWVSKRI
jgi:ubiquinone biosynthesis monooxygenase Coq7